MFSDEILNSYKKKMQISRELGYLRALQDVQEVVMSDENKPCCIHKTQLMDAIYGLSKTKPGLKDKDEEVTSAENPHGKDN